MRFRSIAAAAAAPLVLGGVVLTAGAASASTTPGTPGFVGKGDVQSVYGLNDKALQTDAGSISFVHETTTDTTYTVTAEWDTGTQKIVHHVQHRHDGSVSDTVATIGNQPRTNPTQKVTGFILGQETAISDTTTGDPMPKVGDQLFSAPGSNGVVATVTAVTIDSTTSTDTLAAIDGTKAPAVTALDGAYVWHLGTDGLNPVVGSVNVGTANGSVY